MIKQQLSRAEKLFIEKDYKNALSLYAVILSNDMENSEAYIGALLSDLGFEFKEEAQVLYFYYQSIKNSSDNIKKSMEELITNLIVSTKDDVYELIDADLAKYDGIEYEDFLTLVETKENFKEAFEDAIFSTKVIITKKWQFIDFIKKLTDNGYYSVALNYLETHAPTYENDQDILTLYSLLPKGKL